MNELTLASALAVTLNLAGTPAPKIAGTEAVRREPTIEVLRTRIRVRGDARDRDLVARGLSAILKSQTGAAYSRRFLDSNAATEVVFGPAGDPAEAPGAYTTFDTGAPVVTIDSRFRSESQAKVASILAHEILGHVLANAELSGASWEDFHIYWGDELKASLLGWVVYRELGRDPKDHPNFRDYLSRGNSQDAPRINGPLAYAQALTFEELEDPQAALSARRAHFESLVAGVRYNRELNRFLEASARHFNEAHPQWAADPAPYAAKREKYTKTEEHFSNSSLWLKRILKNDALGDDFVDRWRALRENPSVGRTESEIAALKALLDLSEPVSALPEALPGERPPTEEPWEILLRRGAADYLAHPDHFDANDVPSALRN